MEAISLSTTLRRWMLPDPVSTGPLGLGLGARRGVDGGHLGRRGTEAPLDVGQPLADHRQLLAQVGVALL